MKNRRQWRSSKIKHLLSIHCLLNKWGNMDCDRILWLLSAIQEQLLHLPSWSWRSDEVICISELRMGIMAKSCLAPGCATLLSNLITRIPYKVGLASVTVDLNNSLHFWSSFGYFRTSSDLSLAWKHNNYTDWTVNIYWLCDIPTAQTWARSESWLNMIH